MRPVDIIRRVAPSARGEYLAAFEDGDALLKKYGITTKRRLAHFLAQVCHESGGLTLQWESGAYSAKRLLEIFGVGRHSARVTPIEAQRLAYNGPAIFERVYGLGNPKKARELGNTQPGDGYRYRGGGILQTTGRGNYRRMGQKCGVDFEAHPELVVSAEHALKPALVEWGEGNLNTYADRDEIEPITKRINGGYNGLADRRRWLAKIKQALALTSPLELRASASEPEPELIVPLQRGDALASKIIAAAEARGYRVDRGPGEVNIIYVEGLNPDGTKNDDAADKWNDLRTIVKFEGGAPVIAGKWRATTEPGRYYTTHPVNKKGAARIEFGQYNAWQVGMHRGDHEALVQTGGAVTVCRDLNKDGKRTGDKRDTGYFGINQHWGYDLATVGKASAGCLVGQSKDGHREFMSVIKTDPRYVRDSRYVFATSILAEDDVLAAAAPVAATTKPPAATTTSILAALVGAVARLWRKA